MKKLIDFWKEQVYSRQNWSVKVYARSSKDVFDLKLLVLYRGFWIVMIIDIFPRSIENCKFFNNLSCSIHLFLIGVILFVTSAWLSWLETQNMNLQWNASVVCCKVSKCSSKLSYITLKGTILEEFVVFCLKDFHFFLSLFFLLSRSFSDS